MAYDQWFMKNFLWIIDHLLKLKCLQFAKEWSNLVLFRHNHKTIELFKDNMKINTERYRRIDYIDWPNDWLVGSLAVFRSHNDVHIEQMKEEEGARLLTWRDQGIEKKR